MKIDELIVINPNLQTLSCIDKNNCNSKDFYIVKTENNFIYFVCNNCKEAVLLERMIGIKYLIELF